MRLNLESVVICKTMRQAVGQFLSIVSQIMITGFFATTKQLTHYIFLFMILDWLFYFVIVI